MHIYLLAALSFLLGAVVQSMTGFGFGIIVMTLLPFFMPSYGLCLSVSGLLGFIMALSIAIRQRKLVEWKLLLPPLISFLLVNNLAVWISSTQPDSLLRRVLGGFLILLGLYFMFFSGRVTIRPLPRNGLIAGAVGGALGGLFGMGGPPVVLYMLSASGDENKYRASMQAYFSFTGLITLISRYANGQLTWEALPYAGIGLAFLAAGAFIGAKLFRLVNTDNLRKIIYGVISLSGVILLVR